MNDGSEKYFNDETEEVIEEISNFFGDVLKSIKILVFVVSQVIWLVFFILGLTLKEADWATGISIGAASVNLVAQIGFNLVLKHHINKFNDSVEGCEIKEVK